MISVARPVIEQSIAFLAFIAGIVSVPMHRHQMILDPLHRIGTGTQIIHFAASRIEALSPFNHLLLGVLWAVPLLMPSILVHAVKPLQTHFALKPGKFSLTSLTSHLVSLFKASSNPLKRVPIKRKCGFHFRVIALSSISRQTCCSLHGC